MTLDRVARHVTLEGRVQGVGFRWHTRAEARALGVDGWVKNLPDGSVEVWFEGDRRAVDALLEWARRGPAGARVECVDVRDATPGALAGFEIRR